MRMKAKNLKFLLQTFLLPVLTQLEVVRKHKMTSLEAQGWEYSTNSAKLASFHTIFIIKSVSNARIFIFGIDQKKKNRE